MALAKESGLLLSRHSAHLGANRFLRLSLHSDAIKGLILGLHNYLTYVNFFLSFTLAKSTITLP
jgi:hypothetical protein